MPTLVLEQIGPFNKKQKMEPVDNDKGLQGCRQRSPSQEFDHQNRQGRVEKAFLILPSVSKVLPRFFDAVFGHLSTELADSKPSDNLAGVPSDDGIHLAKPPPTQPFDNSSFDFSLDSTGSCHDGISLSPPNANMFWSPPRNDPTASSTPTSPPQKTPGFSHPFLTDQFQTEPNDRQMPGNGGIIDNLKVDRAEPASLLDDFWDDLDEMNGTKLNNSRQHEGASLGTVARRFHNLLKDQEDGRLHIDQAAARLGKPRRRIYDVIHVLWAAGWIEDASKGWVSWNRTGPIHTRKQELRQQISELEQEEQLLNQWIDVIKSQNHQLRSSTTRRRKLYIRYSDLKNSRDFRQSNIIAIRAPRDTFLEVPDPDKDMPVSRKRYQMFLSSGGNGKQDVERPLGAQVEPIRLYLVQHSPLLENSSSGRPGGASTKKITPVKRRLEFSPPNNPRFRCSANNNNNNNNNKDPKPPYNHYLHAKANLVPAIIKVKPPPLPRMYPAPGPYSFTHPDQFASPASMMYHNNNLLPGSQRRPSLGRLPTRRASSLPTMETHQHPTVPELHSPPRIRNNIPPYRQPKHHHQQQHPRTSSSQPRVGNNNNNNNNNMPTAQSSPELPFRSSQLPARVSLPRTLDEEDESMGQYLREFPTSPDESSLRGKPESPWNL